MRFLRLCEATWGLSPTPTLILRSGRHKETFLAFTLGQVHFKSFPQYILMTELEHRLTGTTLQTAALPSVLLITEIVTL